MPTYRNHRSQAVYLVDPRGSTIVIKPGQTVILDDYFDRYTKQGIITKVANAKAISNIQTARTIHNPPTPMRVLMRQRPIKTIRSQRSYNEKLAPTPGTESVAYLFHQRALVAMGEQHSGRINLTATLQKNLEHGGYPISNGVGVGISSYNNGNGLKCIIDYVRKHIDLQAVTVFVSDDCSTDPGTLAYLAELASCNDLVVLCNKFRLGIDGNNDRLRRCLARFGRCILLSDTVEVGSIDWYRPPARVRDCKLSDESAVPAISYVIPVRNIDRSDAISTVVNNVRAQRFPVIDIIMIEQDETTRLDLVRLDPLIYSRVGGEFLFNKSIAFNTGVAAVRTDCVVLHDADMLAPSWYTAKVASILASYDGCHMGRRVLYANQGSSGHVNMTGKVEANIVFDRMVGYHEGGSLACGVDTYWNVGGFNEDFKGYGNEDWDFFYRLSEGCRFFNERTTDWIHLWHSKNIDHAAHNMNVALERELRNLPFEGYVKLQAERVAHYRVSK